MTQLMQIASTSASICAICGKILNGDQAMRRAAIVSPIRTPVGKFLGSLSGIQAGDLGAVILKALVERTKIDPETIDDVIFAQGYGNGEAPCIARWSALAAGLPISTPGYQLDRRCGSGLPAVIDAAML